MKWRLAILFIIFAGLLFVLLLPSVRNRVGDMLSYSACNTPMSYKIGTVDSRFGLSNGNVQNDLQQATDIWSIAEGKTLFVYSPNAQLTVNFVYDKRQALNSQIQQLDTNLSQKNASLQQKINDFRVQQVAFEQKLAAFNTLVDKYNNQGGASADVYTSLLQQKGELDREATSLNATARQLNLSTSDYNTGVATLNQDIHQLNVALSQMPEEGLFNGNDNTITIYITNSQAELIHTLAHEFGHALGMVHVASATSIMFPDTSSSLTVTPNDMEQLKFVCRQQSIIVHEAVVLNIWLITHIQTLRQDFLNK